MADRTGSATNTRRERPRAKQEQKPKQGDADTRHAKEEEPTATQLDKERSDWEGMAPDSEQKPS
jgi:hypothetical protein